MKNFLFILFLGVAHASSLFPMTELFLDIKINYGKLEEACDSISQLDTDFFSNYAELFCDRTGFLYPSPFDTTVSIGMSFDDKMIWFERLGQYCDGDIGKGFTTRGEPAAHQFSEVLIQELSRLQRLGIFDIDKDSINILSLNLISDIKENFENCSDIDMVEYDGINTGPIKTSKTLYGCCSLVKSPDALPSVAWTPSSIRFTKMGESRFFIHGIPNGTDYTLFDLNGKMLKQGVMLSKIIQPPMLPAILKIQNQIMMLK